MNPVTDSPASYLVFASGPHHYAAPAPFAQEVVVAPMLTRIPGAPSHLSGVFIHRGEVIPVVDVSSLMGRTPQACTRALLLRLPQGPLAVSASEVLGLSPVAGALAPQDGRGAPRSCLLGPGDAQGRSVDVLDTQRLYELLSRPR